MLSTWKTWVIWTRSVNLCLENIRLLCGQKYISLCLRLKFLVNIFPLSSELKLLPRLFWFEGTFGLWWDCTLGNVMVGSHSWLSRKGAGKEQPHEKRGLGRFSINGPDGISFMVHTTFWPLPFCLCTETLESSVDAVTQTLRSGGLMLWL